MPSLWNINGVGNLSNKKLASRLSFDLGESFSGRISSLEEDGTVSIKLLDGWQFSAVILSEGQELPEGIAKFKVQGYEDGKLILKLLGQEVQEGSKEPMLLNYLRTLGLSSNEEGILLMLLKHNIKLSKDNINLFKGLMDIRDKAANNQEVLDEFINKYIKARDIDINSSKGQRVSELLRNTFKLLVTVDEKDILTFIENDIPLTEENIKSYNEVVKSWGSIPKALEDIKNEMRASGFDNRSEGSIANSKEASETASKAGEMEHHNKSEVGKGPYNKETYDNDKVDLIEGREKHSSKYLRNYDSKDKGSLIAKLKEIAISKEGEQYLTEEAAEEAPSKAPLKALEDRKPIEKIEGFLEAEGEAEGEEKSGLSISSDEPVDIAEEGMQERDKSIPKKGSMTSHEAVKLQIKERPQELKNTIEVLLKALEKKGDDLPEKLYNLLLGKNNDFKLLNHLSREYYYLDIPLKLYEREYPLKLIIKDSREKGKKIDSKNVKLVISVSTANMGVIDGYLHLSGKNLSIKLATYDRFIKIFEAQKEKLLSSLMNLGYNADILVTKKTEDATISNSREFFDHNVLAILDALV